MADYEFKAASRDGYGMDWALNYADLSPTTIAWNVYRRKRRRRRTWPQFPDGEFLPAMPLNCAESIFTAAARGLGWPSTHRRLAQLTQHAQQPPALPLLRQLRKRMRRRRDVQHGFDDTSASA